MGKRQGKYQSTLTKQRYSVPLQLIDLIENIEIEARELAQATEYTHLAMVSNGEYLGDTITGMLGTLELSANTLHRDIEKLSCEAHRRSSSYKLANNS